MPPRRYRQSIFRILRTHSPFSFRIDRRSTGRGDEASGDRSGRELSAWIIHSSHGGKCEPTRCRNGIPERPPGGFGESLRTPGKTVSENRRTRHSQLHITFPLYGTGKFSYLVSAYMHTAANDRRPAGTVPAARTDRGRTPTERTR